MSRRGWLFITTIVPIMGFIAILAWASLNRDTGPTGIGVNTGFGKIDIESTLAPEFDISLGNGKTLSLSDLRGKVVLIDFWASWCAPCRHEADILAETYLEYTDQPIEFVGINIWDNPEAASLHLQEFKPRYPNGIDIEGKIGIDYGVSGIPEKYFVDAKGRLSRKYIGPIQPKALRAIIADLIVH